jgi:ABC-type antimicrobial peptide transport system permease subunit
VLKEVDPAVPVREMRTVEMLARENLQRERTLATLSGVFGVVALLLVGVGLYGLIAGAVSTRTREIGVRVALGAKPSSVAWFVTRESALLVAVGAATGLAAGFYLSKLIETQFFGVTASDPSIYLLSGLILVVCAGLAAFVPARRAARVDPVAALRCD